MKKQIIKINIIILLFMIGLSGCIEKNVNGIGKIQYNDFEGGFYGIVGDDGEYYDPINLQSEFKEDGLQVKYTLKILENQTSVHMWGTIVKIIKIEKL